MTQLSITDTALSGFRFVRRNPTIIAQWAALHLVISVVTAVVMVTTAGPAMTAMASGAQQSPAETIAMFQQLAPFYGLLFVFSLVYYPAFYAAICRAGLRSAESSFAYLRLGGDELRQFLLFLLFSAVGLGAYLVLAIGIGILFALMIGVAGRGVAAGLIAGAIFFVVFGAFAFAMVRLSLAAPMTFDRNRVALFPSWKLTRGVFWKLFGAYLLAMLLLGVLILACVAILGGVALAAGDGFAGLQQIIQPDMSSFQAYLRPVQLANFAISAALMAVIWPVALMPMVEAYKQLAHKDDHTIFD